MSRVINQALGFSRYPVGDGSGGGLMYQIRNVLLGAWTVHHGPDKNLL